jgi:hypothetical protein
VSVVLKTAMLKADRERGLCVVRLRLGRGVLLPCLRSSGRESVSVSTSPSASNQLPLRIRFPLISAEVADVGDTGFWETSEEQRPDTDVAAVVKDCSRVRTAERSIPDDKSLPESEISAGYRSSPSCSNRPNGA